MVIKKVILKIKQLAKDPDMFVWWIIHRLKLEKCTSDKLYMKLMYKKFMNKSLNLRNPKTLNEKLIWLTLFDHNPYYSMLVDKYEFKLMTVEHNLYLGDRTNKDKIKKIMTDNGYVLYREDVINVGDDPFEDWYYNPKYVNI